MTEAKTLQCNFIHTCTSPLNCHVSEQCKPMANHLRNYGHVLVHPWSAHGHLTQI